jgi:uncharacterized membrane protein YdbT with pleckstrin-like domain
VRVRRHVIVSQVWVIVLWSAIPVAVLLPAFTIGTYWFFRYFNQRHPRELPVERVYREATTRQMARPGAGNAPSATAAGSSPHLLT